MSDPIQTPPAGTEEVEPLIPEDAEPGEQPEVPQVTPEVPEEPQVPEEPAPETLLPQDPPPPPAPPAAPDYKEKFQQSTSEAMILNSKNKNLEGILNKITSEDTPTEAELLAEYPTFRQYDATTQKVFRDTLTNSKMNKRILRQQAEADADRKWQADLRALTGKAEYAALRNDPAFEQFVFQPKHQNVDIQVLADAYMVRTGKIAPQAPPPTKPAPPNSGGLPRGSGGPRTQPKTAKISIEQASVLRQTNYKEYMRLLKAGQIEQI